MNVTSRASIRLTRGATFLIAATFLFTSALSSLAQTPRDWPAFHAGGTLEGVAAPVGGPPLKLRWTYRTADHVPAGTQAGRFEGSAVISGGLAMIADTAGVLHAVDLKSGKQAWAYPGGDGFETTPLVHNGKVL